MFGIELLGIVRLVIAVAVGGFMQTQRIHMRFTSFHHQQITYDFQRPAGA